MQARGSFAGGDAIAQPWSPAQIAEKVVDWRPSESLWPMAGADIRARLPMVGVDPAVVSRVEPALAAYDGEVFGSQDRRVVQSDPGLHNIAFDAATGAVNG